MKPATKQNKKPWSNVGTEQTATSKWTNSLKSPAGLQHTDNLAAKTSVPPKTQILKNQELQESKGCTG